MKSYREFIIHSEFYNECYKEPRNKNRTSICYKLVWQSIVANDFSNDNIRQIFR